jgi:hypothetical protein
MDNACAVAGTLLQYVTVNIKTWVCYLALICQHFSLRSGKFMPSLTGVLKNNHCYSYILETVFSLLIQYAGI